MNEVTEEVIEPKPTLKEIVEKAKGKKIISGDHYLIVTSSIYNYKKLSTEEKEKLKRNQRKISAKIMEKFNPLVVYFNAGKIVIIFDKNDHGNHRFQGYIDLINGCINSYLIHLFYDLIENIWFTTSCYGEKDYKKAYAYLLHTYRKSKKRRLTDYIQSFDKEELDPVKYDKVAKKLEYIEDLIGIGYYDEEDSGFFTKYKKVDNPDSKFGFDRVVKHIQKEIYFHDKDIDYIMAKYI